MITDHPVDEMTGFDAVMEIVLGNIKLASEKAEGIVPFLRQIQECFGPTLALVHDMSKGILAAIAEVFPGVPDFVCHFHFLRDAGKDLLGAAYDTLRQRLQRHGTVGRLRSRLRAWRQQIQADPALQQALEQLPAGVRPSPALAQAPLLAAYILTHWIVGGLQQGHGYGFPFDRPLLALDGDHNRDFRCDIGAFERGETTLVLTRAKPDGPVDGPRLALLGHGQQHDPVIRLSLKVPNDCFGVVGASVCYDQHLQRTLRRKLLPKHTANRSGNYLLLVVGHDRHR